MTSLERVQNVIQMNRFEEQLRECIGDDLGPDCGVSAHADPSNCENVWVILDASRKCLEVADKAQEDGFGGHVQYLTSRFVLTPSDEAGFRGYYDAMKAKFDQAVKTLQPTGLFEDDPL